MIYFDTALVSLAVNTAFGSDSSSALQAIRGKLSLRGSVPVIYELKSGPEIRMPHLCSVACMHLTT